MATDHVREAARLLLLRAAEVALTDPRIDGINVALREADRVAHAEYGRVRGEHGFAPEGIAKSYRAAAARLAEPTDLEALAARLTPPPSASAQEPAND